MGYRSQIALCLEENIYLYGIKWMRHYGVPDSLNLLLPDGSNSIRRTGDMVLIYWDSVKWYSMTFIDIRILYAFLKTVSVIEDKFGLLHVGESYDDISYEGSHYMVSECGIYPYSNIDLGDMESEKSLSLQEVEELVSKDENKYIFFNCQPDLTSIINEF